MSDRPACTLAAEALVQGIGLHSGAAVRCVLGPAAPGEGIRFVRTDLEGAPSVAARVHNRVELLRRTALRDGAAEVHTVEHVLAALWGLGVTDAVCALDGIEVPGLDGSARGFCEAIDSVGLVQHPVGRAPVVALDRRVEVTCGESRVVAEPCPGRLVLAYHLDYGGAIPDADVEVCVSPARFRSEVSGARTFCLEAEARALQAAGFGKGASTRNTLVFGADGRPIENELRFADEPARHKVLDLLGDLALLGAWLEARVSAVRGGHALNARLCEAIREAMGLGAPAAE